MEKAKKEENHETFECWRSTNPDELSAKERMEFQNAAEKSTQVYSAAFCQTLRETTMNQFESLFDAFAENTKVAAIQVYLSLLGEQVNARASDLASPRHMQRGLSIDVDHQATNPMLAALQNVTENKVAMPELPMNQPSDSSDCDTQQSCVV